MFSIIRLTIKIAFILLVGILVLAYFTNPSLEDFKNEAKSRMKTQMDEMGMDPKLKTIAEMSLSVTDGLIESNVKRKNYYVCSIYEVSLPGGDYRYAGAFHTFYPLQDDDPFEKFMKTINDLKISPADGN